MLKKSFALLAACLLLVSVFAGCGKKNKNNGSGLQTDDSVVATFERIESKAADATAQKIGGDVIYDCYTFESIDSETVMITGFYSETKGKTAAPDAESQSYVRCLVPHTVCVPTKLAGKTVAKIGDSAFRQHSEISLLVLPESVTALGQLAFEECSNLQSVALPASVAEIGLASFRNCTALTSLTFAAESALSAIPKSAFAGCSSLAEIHIPAYIKTIGDGAFLNCTSVTVLTLEEGLETIGDQAFQNLNLTTVPALPSTVTAVGEWNPF